METNEIEKLENLKKIIEKYFNNPRSDGSEFYTSQIKINYYELGLHDYKYVENVCFNNR